MKRNEDFKNALGQPDEYFRQSVIDTLDQLNRQAEKESRPQRRYAVRIAASFAALAVAVTGIFLGRQHLPGMSPDGSIDAINPTPVVTTQLTAESSSVVETDLATLSIRNAGINGDTVYASVEVMPRKKKSLALNWSIHPYTDSVSIIGKTPDYEGQTIMDWAREHDYEEIIRVVFANAFEPLTPGVVTPINQANRVGLIPDPAFDSLHTDHSEYEDNGATIIDVTGHSMPDTKEYLVGFVLQTWDMTLTDHANHDSAFGIDTQIFGNIPFTIDEPEEPEVNAEYNPAPDVTDVQPGPDWGEKFTQGVVINTLPESNAAESELATVTLLKADTDGFGVFLSFEVKPRHEKTLIVDTHVDPYMDSPRTIGLTPDRSGQTILEWAVEHGFEELLDVELYSSSDDSDPTFTAGFHSYPRTQEEDGSVIVDVYGSALPNTDLYYLCCKAVPWDMNGKNTYIDGPDGREIQLALLEDQAAYAFLKIPVTAEKEKPITFATYYTNAGIQNSNYTVYLFRTSMAEYCETWTNNPDYADNWFSSLSTIPSGSPVFTQAARTPIHARIQQENGSVIFRDTVILPEEYPDTLSLEFTSIQGTNQADPPVTIKKLLPVEEYTRQAWSSTAERLSDLFENPEARIGQVYEIKGVVETDFLANHPGRVIINAGENGEYLPVFVERPAYCNFTWENGVSYRIFADVTSIEDNTPILTARYSFNLLTHNTVDTDYASLTVREAKTDGYGVFLQLEVQPKEEKILVIPGNIDFQDTSIMKLGIDERKSIYQWAVDNGYKLLVVNFPSTTDTTDSGTDRTSGFHPYWNEPSFTTENGSTVIKAVRYAIPDTAQYELGYTLAYIEEDPSGGPVHHSLGEGVIPVTVTETEEPKVIAEYKATSSSSADTPTPDATLTLLRSSCSGYCVLRSSDTKHMSDDLVHYGWMLSNDFFADGELVEWGERANNFVLSYQEIEEDNTLVVCRSWTFPEEIPDKFRLGETSGYYSGLYEKVR